MGRSTLEGRLQPKAAGAPQAAASGLEQLETKMTRAQVEAIMDPKVARYLLPEEALKLGIIDKIIGDGR